MPEFTIEVEFDVYCSKCGAPLCQQSTATDYHRGGRGRRVDVEPCDKCMDEAATGGYNEGHNDGYDEGLDEGSRER